MNHQTDQHHDREERREELDDREPSARQRGDGSGTRDAGDRSSVDHEIDGPIDEDRIPDRTVANCSRSMTRTAESDDQRTTPPEPPQVSAMAGPAGSESTEIRDIRPRTEPATTVSVPAGGCTGSFSFDRVTHFRDDRTSHRPPSMGQ